MHLLIAPKTWHACKSITPRLIKHFVFPCAGAEEIPAGAVAVLLLGSSIDMLSHSAVRARNAGVILACCHASAEDEAVKVSHTLCDLLYLMQ